MEAYLLEKANAKLVTLPVDLNTAAVTGGRVSAKGTKRITFLVQMGDSTGATVQFDLKQHNAASGGTTKALSVANKYYKKAGAATSWTQVEPTVAADSYDLSADFAGEEGMVAFEVLEEDLDVNGGFTHVSVNIADSGAAKLASVVAICHGLDAHPGYSQAL